MADIITCKINEVYTKIIAEPAIHKELSEYFTFKIPDAHFNPLVKAKKWDGLIRLFDMRSKHLYTGLLRYLFVFAKERNYTIHYDPDLVMMNNFSLEEAKEFITSLNIQSRGEALAARDYQEVAFAKAIRYKRLTIVSPTASGKSYIIYCFMRYLLQVKHARCGLLIVPTTSLVEQMVGDFEDYSSANGWNVVGSVQKLYEGFSASLLPQTRLLVSTWQSLYTQPKEFFERFEYVIGDEAHTFAAKCVGGVAKALTNANYRLALTGTTDEHKINNLQVEGYFGPITKTVSTRELMDRGFIAELFIKSLVLKHPPGTKELVSSMKKKFFGKTGDEESPAAAAFQAEMAYLIASLPRNKFIRNLTLSIKGNTLLLFHYVEKHGQVLYDLIKEKLGDSERKCFFVHGGTETEQREQIRAITEGEEDAIIIASFGVFSTGINIRRLHNVIFGSPTKSKKRTLQSIGRGLRLGDGKTTTTLYDLADDFREWPEDEPNYTLRHYGVRMLLYYEEKFKVSHYPIDLKN